MAEGVTCQNCGFLAKYCPEPVIPTPRYFEVDLLERLDGMLFQHALEVGHIPRRAYPACFRQVSEVTDEFLPFTDLVHKDQNRVIEIINKSRTCSKWFQFTPGFDPKAHLEEFRVIEMESQRKAFETRMQEDNKSFVRELHASNRNLQIFLACVVIVFTIAQTGFPNGWPWLMRLLGTQPTLPPLPPMPGF